MIVFLIGLFIFFSLHLIPTQPSARAQLIERLGAFQYSLSFSLGSALGLGLMIWGFSLAYGSAANITLWTPPHWMRHFVFLLMAFAFIFLAAAYIPCRIRDALKHPMLVSVKTWAFAHLLVNGDLLGVTLFGSFLAYAVYDRISVKKRAALGPLGAQHGKPWGDALAVGIGLAAWAAVLFGGHAWLIGRPLLSLS